MKHSIRHLKRHRNILYGLVTLLVVIQVFSFIALSSQLAQVYASHLALRNSFNGELDAMKEENQYKFSELSREVSHQRTDLQEQLTQQQATFEHQINVLRASQDDFSAIIEDVIKGVTSITTDKSAGTGFIVQSGGYVITNHHVINGARFVQVLTYTNEVYTAEIVGVDENLDLALLKIEGIFDHLEFAQPTTTDIGEKVIAIGNPLGLSFTVTEGIISALDRTGPNGMDAYIQTDVTLNPGNSGGPLINTEGHVVGVNNFKLGNAEGLGFALESSHVISFIERFVEL